MLEVVELRIDALAQANERALQLGTGEPIADPLREQHDLCVEDTPKEFAWINLSRLCSFAQSAIRIRAQRYRRTRLECARGDT